MNANSHGASTAPVKSCPHRFRSHRSALVTVFFFAKVTIESGDTATAHTLRMRDRALERVGDSFTSSIMLLLLARGAGSAPAVGYSDAPAVSNAAPFESCASQIVRHCFTSETKDKALLNHAGSCKKASVTFDFWRLDC